MAAITLWVRAEPFDFGTLQAPPPAKLTLSNIGKLVQYSRSKGSSGYPRLSYQVWRHVACNKLLITEDIAWMYFELFDMLSESGFRGTLDWGKAFSLCKTKESKDHLRNRASVDTLQFALFLFIQQIHKISLRASLVTGEEWPTRTRSPDLDKKGSLGAKSLDEHSHLMFVLNHLNDILELLLEPAEISSEGVDSKLTIKAVDALGLLIEGSSDGKTVQPLHELARGHYEATKTGFSKISRSFAFRQFQSWLRSSLNISPFGVSACLMSSGKRLKSAGTAEGGGISVLSLNDSLDDEKLRQSGEWSSLRRARSSSVEADEAEAINKETNQGRGRLMNNRSYAPKRYHIVILHQVCKQTVAKTGEQLKGNSVKVHRCHFSYIYLLAPLRSVNIERCHNSTIILGAVETAVSLTACENVHIITVCKRPVLSACSSCTVYTSTECRPLLLAYNENITLAPYHTHYPKLEAHMQVAGLSAAHNEWNNPLILGPEQSSEDSEKCCKELDPQNFFTFSIPFALDGKTKENPIPLPAKYEESLRTREQVLESWHEFVREAGLTKAQKHQLQSVVQNRFQEWLIESGNAQQLDGLAPPSPAK